jgi:hypothetical protein
MSSDEKTLHLVAESAKPLPSFSRSKDGFSRADVVSALHRAFHMTGGVERLTLWANANYGDFIKVYAKLLPATTVNIGEVTQLKIVHAIPPTALDKHEIPAIIVDAEAREVLPARVEDE